MRVSLIFGIGIILIFCSVYLFTRERLWEAWNFSETGQIGDTIGGISAPLINLFGAYLLFISFRAQIAANKIQSNALEEEKIRNNLNKVFEQHQATFDKITQNLKDLEFVVQTTHNGFSGNPQTIYTTYKGVNALEEYVIGIEGIVNIGTFSKYGVFLNILFISSSILDLINRINHNVENQNDKNYFFDNLGIFYRVNLEKLIGRMLKAFDKKDAQVQELLAIKNDLDKIFNK